MDLKTMDWVLIIGAVLNAVILPLAFLRIWFLYRVISAGQPAPDRLESVKKNLVASIGRQFIEVFGQKKLLKWTIPGVAHAFVMYAFLILASVYFEAYAVLIARDPEWHWWIFNSWAPLGFVQDLIAVLCLVGIVAFYFIRVRNNPHRVGRSSRFSGSHLGGAYLVLFMIFNVLWTMFLFRGAVEAHDRLQDGVGYGKGAFVSWALGQVLPRDAMWLIGIGLLLHIGVMLVFLLDVLHSKHLHIFIAPINVLFGRRPDALGAVKPLMSDGKAITLEDVENLDEDAKLGVGSIEDFSWKAKLDFASCTECGRCQSQCPAWNTDKPLSPKMLIMNLRDNAMASAPYLLADGNAEKAGADAVNAAARPLVGETEGDPTEPSGGAVIDPDVLWSCTNCGACVNQCPVDIEHIDHIDDMRRYQVLVESNFPSELNGLFRGLEQKGNPWNLSPNSRMDWAQGLDFPVRVVGQDVESMEDVDWLFWVGCAGAYEDRAKKTTRAVAELFNIAGVDFAVLGNGETCTGDSARRAGNEFVYQALAEQNIETFKEMKVKKVVSTCPHCMNTLKNEYRQLGFELEVLHHTQLLNRLVRDKKLTPKPVPNGEKRSITYHDPCFLGRHNQEYNAPRELLDIVPEAARIEMARSGEKSFCCGAGGARMWMEETIGERINVNRTQEAVGTGADEIAVACPFCRVMLDDGLTSEQAEGRAREEVQVLDVAQMLLSSVKGEAPARKARSAQSSAPAAATASATAVAEKPAEAPAAPSAGGSLFDTPAPEAPKADKPAEAPAEPKADSSMGGSLFDVAPTEAPAAPKAEAAKSEAPKAETPKAEASKAETPKAEKAEPAADLGGGSLFDIPATPAAPAAEPAAEKPAEPAAKEKAEEPAADKAEEPAAEKAEEKPADKAEEKPAAPASTPKSDADINNAGSLFDL